MGTNYYAETERKNVCAHCGRGDAAESLHIGKSSGGWCFSLHVIPERGLITLDAWQLFLENPEVRICDEYRQPLTLLELLDKITNRSWPQGNSNRPIGYASWAAFHHSNHSESGPNGLVRHRIGHSCIGHGEGTWDYITGEFS